MRGRCSTDREDVHPLAADGRVAGPDTAAPEPWAALLTPPGRGALAVVGVAGTGAVAVVERLFAARGGRPLAGRASGSIAFGTWRPTGEDVVIVVEPDDRLEIHGHGGLAAAEAVIASLECAGVRRRSWCDWPAVAGGATAREARAAICRAGGPKAARILARQAAGLLDREIDRIDATLAAGDPVAARRACMRLLAAARVGLRLVRPWRVVLAGTVNAGKSSLVNALLGHGRSIVSSAPGTTRDVVTARAVLDGWEVDLVDVAGTRDDEVAGAVERAGIARALAARESADLVLRLVPADTPPGNVPLPGAAELVVVTKADLAPGVTVPGAVVTSALTGTGIEGLVAAIVDRLVPEDRRDPDLLAGPVPFTPRQVEALEAVCRG